MKSHLRVGILVAGLSITLVGLCAAWTSTGKETKSLGPEVLLASPDGARLYVLEADAKRIDAVDLASGKIAQSVAVPDTPTGLVLNREGTKLYVTCAAVQSKVCLIDTKAMKITQTLAAGHTAIGPALSPDGRRLYVCNRFNNSVSVIDLEQGKELACVPVVREPHAAAITPDGKQVYVANHLPNDPADSYDVAAVVSVIDTATLKVHPIRLLNGSSGLRAICVSPDGKYVYVPHILARYQMPTTQLERGWMNTNALSIIDAGQQKLLNTVLLDDVDLGAAVPWGVACTADGQTVCVAHAGTSELSVIQIAGVLEKIDKIPAELKPGQPKPEVQGVYASMVKADIPNDLAFLVDLRRRIRLEGKGTRAVAVVGDKAYVPAYFSDLINAVELAAKPGKLVNTLALGPTPVWSVQRRGEVLFNDATICFQHWQSCASCHPDARVDALNWDLMNDGLGNPKNNKSMLLTHKTPPSMWTAVRPDGEMGVRSGLTHILFAVRPEEEAVAMDEYLKALQPVPSPHLVNGQLSPAAERGKKIFHDPEVGCARCHPEPLYTDMLMHDVGSEGPYDRRSTFDTPSLVECWRTAPYLHDGKWTSIKDLIVKGKHGERGGKIDHLSEQQIDDLVEYVLSL